MKTHFLIVRTHAAALMVLLGCGAGARAQPLLPLNEGERVLFLGNGFFENDQRYAYLETRLERRFPRRALTFRTMGWSGDTVRGSARTDGYQVPAGLARLEKEVLALKPTVIFLAYGMNESFAGPQGLAAFVKDYDKLLGRLAPLQARLVIVSPTYHEDLGRPFADPTEHNRQLQQYATALQKLAAERKLLFVDLFHPLELAKKANAGLRLTTNGILLAPAGYALAAKITEEQLGFAPLGWEVTVDAAGKVVSSKGTKLASISASGGTLRFQTNDTMVQITNPPDIAPEVHRLGITGFPQGDYLLKIDGQKVLHASAAEWQRGVNITTGPMVADGEKLRAAIVLRNELFYRRWRPYNDHSRHWGYIGGDYKLYDRDIASQEQRIAELCIPRPRTYEISAK